MRTSFLALLALLTVLPGTIVRAASATQKTEPTYDTYAGDFNGDGQPDVLYVALEADGQSGIALSDGQGPNIAWQAWKSPYLGIT